MSNYRFSPENENIPSAEDALAVAVERFYLRSARAWVVRYVDAAGRQVGNAEYIGSGKANAIRVERQMKASI